MSDIPIGSPPVPPGRHAAPQGWYPDPVDHSQERYWDGWSWSRNTRQSEQPGPHPQQGQQFPHQQGGYQQPPQGHTPHQQGPYQQGPYQQGPYQQGPYQPGPQQQALRRPGAVPLTADGVPIAGWGWRFLSGLLDLIIVTIVADIFSIPIFIKMIPAFKQYFNQTMAAAERGTIAPTLNPGALISGTDQIVITVISLAVGLLYFSLFWRFKAATPAQLICGLRIVPVDRGHNVEPLPWASAVIRAVVWWVPVSVSNVLLIFAIVNVLFPLGNAKRQAIHDLAGSTQIVKLR